MPGRRELDTIVINTCGLTKAKEGIEAIDIRIIHAFFPGKNDVGNLSQLWSPPQYWAPQTVGYIDLSQTLHYHVSN